METPLVIADFLGRAEVAYPDRVAIVDEPHQPAPSLGSLTYRELGERARGMAAFLDDLGLEVGARVAIVSHNAARLLAAYYGVCGSGRVLVPVNFRLAIDDIAYIVAHSGAELVLLDPEVAAFAEQLGHPKTMVLGDDDDLLFPLGRIPAPWEPDESATATINYTSGTTARPKGVQLTHRNLWLNAVIFSLHLGVSDRDVLLHTLPIFHVNGWGMPFGLTGMGGRHIILRKVDGAEILRRIAEHEVTLLCGAPAVINAVLDAAESWPGEIPGAGTVRVVVAGAAPPTSIIERVETELGWEFIQIYGLTETSPVLTVNRTRSEWDDLTSHDRAQMLGRAGVPAIGTTLAINNDGEVLARSNMVLQSYWDNHAATSEALAGGWFHTGDGGVIDEKGYLKITDRKKDVIITGGENVSSIEVEDVLLHHPAIREVAVIGIPDDTWGELVTALVVTDDDDLTEEAVIAHARATLAGFMTPKRVEFRDELPRTVTGKLQKAKLREPYWAGRDRQVN
ncbi:MAG: AMP-binding protein [Actinomycetes bacterium]